VMDNYATHNKQEVREWLDTPITVHFTPTSASWMNPVEVWFGIIERKAIDSLARYIQRIPGAGH